MAEDASPSKCPVRIEPSNEANWREVKGLAREAIADMDERGGAWDRQKSSIATTLHNLLKNPYICIYTRAVSCCISRHFFITTSLSLNNPLSNSRFTFNAMHCTSASIFIRFASRAPLALILFSSRASFRASLIVRGGATWSLCTPKMRWQLRTTPVSSYSCPTGVPPDGGTLARPRKLGLASTLKSA